MSILLRKWHAKRMGNSSGTQAKVRSITPSRGQIEQQKKLLRFKWQAMREPEEVDIVTV